MGIACLRTERCSALTSFSLCELRFRGAELASLDPQLRVDFQALEDRSYVLRNGASLALADLPTRPVCKFEIGRLGKPQQG